MKKVSKIFCVLVTACLLFIGCAGSEDENVIKIAVAAPMTGDNAEYGIGFANAAKLMVAEWNEKGGVLGKPVELVIYDDKNNGEEAASIAQQIVADENIVGVIGHFASGVSMAAAPTYEENNLIEISPSASHPDYSSMGDTIFRNNVVISFEAQKGLELIVDYMGKTKVGIVSIKTDWGTSTKDIVKDVIAEEYPFVEIVAVEEVLEGIDDYGPVVTKMNDAGAEVLISVAMYGTLAPLTKQYKQVNPDIEVIGFSNSFAQELINLGGESAEGIMFPISFFPGSEDPAIKKFVSEYNSAYGAIPSSLTAQAYDSVGILLTAVEMAGSKEKDSIKTAMYELNYPGVTGDTVFNEDGDSLKVLTAAIVKDGQFAEVN